MKKYTLFSKIIVSLLLWGTISTAWAQYKTDIPHQNIRESVVGNTPDLALFNSSRFQMHHSFSMSMLNMGGSAVGLGAYTNLFSFALSPKMSLQTQVSLVQPSFGGLQQQGEVYYGVGLNYKATENSFFNFQINNYPTYYKRPNHHFYSRGF